MKLLNKNYLNAYLKQIKDGEINNNFYHKRNFVLQKLLDSGADKDSLDNDEMTPVMWACHFDQYENMELLLNISHEDEMRFEIIDAELKDKDKMGRNLLHWSISNAVNKQCFKV